MYKVIGEYKVEGSVSILFLSDIHLGHRKVPTEDIIESCWDIINDSPRVDIIIIPGDLFERSLSLSSDCSFNSLMFISDLYSYCLTRGMAFFILEGTPSHDRGQSRSLRSIMGNKYKKSTDIMYLDSITSITVKGIDILFVPDKIAESSDETVKLIKEVATDKVHHLMVIHCAFGFQLPDFVDCFVEKDFLPFTKTFIVAGHHHKPCEFLYESDPRILIPGSVDVLNHGENHEKGGLLVAINKDREEACFKRVKNRNPTIFKSIDATELSSLEVQAQIEMISKSTQRTVNVEIRGKSTSEAVINAGVIRSCFPFVAITREIESDPVVLGKLKTTPAVPECLSRDTLERSLMRRIKANQTSRISNISEIIKDVVV